MIYMYTYAYIYLQSLCRIRKQLLLYSKYYYELVCGRIVCFFLYDTLHVAGAYLRMKILPRSSLRLRLGALLRLVANSFGAVAYDKRLEINLQRAKVRRIVRCSLANITLWPRSTFKKKSVNILLVLFLTDEMADRPPTCILVGIYIEP
jgi:hypothetical protein